RRTSERNIQRIGSHAEDREISERHDENAGDQRRRQHDNAHAELDYTVVHDSSACISSSRSRASPRTNWVTRRSWLASIFSGGPSYKIWSSPGFKRLIG